MTLEQKFNEHFEDGRDLGREEGRDQERKETITSMIENGLDRKSTRLNSSHRCTSRMPSSA